MAGLLVRLSGHLLLTAALLLLLMLLIAAYGIPGHWVAARLGAALPDDIAVFCDRIAFRLTSGFVLTGLRLTAGDGSVRAAAEKVAVGLRLRSSGTGWAGHIASLYVKGLVIPVFDWQAPQEKTPFPALSKTVIPDFRGVSITADGISVFDVRAQRMTGRLRSDVEKGRLDFFDLCAVVDGQSEQIEGAVTLDIHDAKAVIRLSGTIYPHRLLGIYRFLDFPVIEAYSNCFALNAPAWANCAITVGFDKWRDLFELDVDLVSRHGGTYCGVPFDSAEGHIACRGIETAVTEIAPLTVRRNDRVAAAGRLRFDCPEDRFTFAVEADGLLPKEAFQIIDMPFTQAIPEILALQPPVLRLNGSMPFMTAPTPATLCLDGSIRADVPVSVAGVSFAAFSSKLSMRNGALTFRNIKAEFTGGGKAEGFVTLEIPPHAEYTDLHAALTLDGIRLRDVLPGTIDSSDLPTLTLFGPVDLRLRTDGTLPRSLNGTFALRADGERILRLPLFAGLTDLLADYLPGVSALTDTTAITAKGTVRDGVLEVPDFRLVGSLLAVEGTVAYAIPDDSLQAALLVGVFREGTIFGDLTRWALLPLARLVTEIEVTGPIASPQWARSSTLQKILPFWND